MLSARQFLAIYESIGGSLIVDLQTRAQGVKFSFNEHGAAACSWSVPCSLGEAFSLYNRCRGRHVEISASGHPIWRGRVEDIRMVSGGLEFSAYGYQNGLRMVPVTSFYSCTRSDSWEIGYTSQMSDCYPNLYRLETKDGISISLQRGDTYRTANDIAHMMLRMPDQSYNTAKAISFDWSITLPTNWVFQFVRMTSAFGFITSATVATGNGSAQSGTYSTTFSATDIVCIRAYNNTGANYTATGETGTQYARVSNVRVKGTTSASLYADEIALSLLAHAVALNPNHISASTANIQSPGVDLRDEIYEDQYAADVLDYLVSLGDNQTPPRQWVWGVDLDQALFVKPRGVGRQWYVDIASPDIEMTLANLANAVFAVYQDASGRPLRTATATDSNSIVATGMIMGKSVNVQTTNATQANTHRDAALADGKDPRPRVGIEISALYSASGQRVHPWVARPGDTITIRNLPPTISADVDRLRTFVLSELEFDCDSGLATLTPESPTPSLDVMVAREAAGVNRAPTVLRPPIVIR